jgi:signal transduction histidine kinase
MSESPAFNLLTNQAYPHVAAALKARGEATVRRYETIVRQTVPRADELTISQLRDDLPRILEYLADTMATAAERSAREFFDVTFEHGLVRFYQNYDLSELLIEYNLLRPLIFEEVLNELGRMMTAGEMVALNAGLDVVVRQAVVAFVSRQSTELQAATEAQSKYLSFLSHDLRGGLNGVFLMIEVLKRELANEPRLAETMDDLDGMRRSLLETVGTMDRFLHAERFRKGKVQIRPGPLDLRTLLHEQVAQLAYQAKDKGIDLHVDCDDNCKLTSDRDMLTLIFQNLLSNAVKYTHKGGVQVEGRCSDDSKLLVSVRDSGPGIAPETLSTLFTPFTRGATHGQSGVGLGLSIARQASELVGARVWAESTVGTGSIFFVQLPKDLPKIAESAKPAAKPSTNGA